MIQVLIGACPRCQRLSLQMRCAPDGLPHLRCTMCPFRGVAAEVAGGEPLGRQEAR